MNKHKYFFFEQQWFLEQDFLSMFEAMWVKNSDKFKGLPCSLDFWHRCLCPAIQHLRGWNANKSSEVKKEKRVILLKLEEMDSVLESGGMIGSGGKGIH
jgi:hypothetical protein